MTPTVVPTSLVLSVGDPPAADSLNLCDNVNYSIPSGQGLGAGVGGGINWGSHVIPPQQMAGSPQPPNTRVVSIPLIVRSDAVARGPGNDQQAQMDALSENRRAVDRKLDQARQAWGAYGVGSKVTLELWRAGHSNPVLYDVAGGVLTPVDAGFLDWTPLEVCLLVLYLSPYSRGPLTTTTVSATLTNATSPPYYVPNVAGDHDAITRLIVRDLSGSGWIQRLRIGLKAARPMAAADFTAIYSAVASTATGNIGTVTALAGTRNGNAVRGTPTTSWKPIAEVVGAGGRLDAGAYDVYAKVRDNGSTIGVPRALTATPTGTGSGFNAYWTYYFAVSAVDSFGNESAASTPVVQLQIPAPNQNVALAWQDAGPAANHNVYCYAVQTGAWYRTATGSAAASYTMTGPGTTAVSGPPTSSAPQMTTGQIQAFAMVAGSNQNLSSIAGRVVPSALANQLWELVWLGTFRLPPGVHQEGQAEQNWRLQFQVIASGPGAATYDVDCIWLMPHDYAASYTEVTAPLGALTQKCDWYIDTRFDGRASCYLYAAGTTTLVGQADMPAGFGLRPGDNLVVIEAEQYLNNAYQPVTAAQFSAQALYEPRYSWDRGIS